MKKIIHTLLLLIAVTQISLAQNTNAKPSTFISHKNKLELDVHITALELTYKHSVGKRLYFGGSLGLGSLLRFNYSESELNKTRELMKTKLLLDVVHKHNKSHMYFALFAATSNDVESDVTNPVFGIEFGYFYNLGFCEIGIEPNIYLGDNSAMNMPLVNVKIPLAHWGMQTKLDRLNQSETAEKQTERNQKRMHIEILAGLNGSQIKGVENKLGFGATIQNVWFVGHDFNLVAGVNFERISTFEDIRHTGGPNLNQKDVTIRSLVFAVPVLARYHIGKQNRLYVEAGPAGQHIPLQCYKGTQTIILHGGASYSSSFSEKEHINTFGADLQVAVGYKLPINSFKCMARASYHKALTSDLYTDNKPLDYFAFKLGIGL